MIHHSTNHQLHQILRASCFLFARNIALSVIRKGIVSSTYSFVNHITTIGLIPSRRHRTRGGTSQRFRLGNLVPGSRKQSFRVSDRVDRLQQLPLQKIIHDRGEDRHWGGLWVCRLSWPRVNRKNTLSWPLQLCRVRRFCRWDNRGYRWDPQYGWSVEGKVSIIFNYYYYRYYFVEIVTIDQLERNSNCWEKRKGMVMHQR